MQAQGGVHVLGPAGLEDGGEDFGLELALNGLHALPPSGSWPNSKAIFRRARKSRVLRLPGRHAEGAGNLLMRSALGIGKPQDGAFARLETGQCAGEIGLALGGGGALAGGNAFDVVVARVPGRAGEAAAAGIAGQIGGDAVERVAAMEFALVGGGGTEEAIEGLLEQVVGQLPVAGDADEIGPDTAGGAFVKAAKASSSTTNSAEAMPVVSARPRLVNVSSRNIGV